MNAPKLIDEFVAGKLISDIDRNGLLTVKLENPVSHYDPIDISDIASIGTLIAESENINEEEFALNSVVDFSQDSKVDKHQIGQQQTSLNFDKEFSPKAPLIGYDSNGEPVVKKISQVVYDEEGYPVGEILSIVSFHQMI